MGFRFRKSKNFGPLRINLSKSGVGWSVGTKGARYTKRADGKKQTTLSIPGTGLSYVEVSGDNKNSSNTNKNDTNFTGNNNSFYNNDNNNNNDNTPKDPFYKRSWFIWLLLIFIPPVGIILMWTSKKYNKKPRIALSIIFALYALVLYTPTSPSNNETAKNTTTQTSKTELAEKKKDDEAKIAAEEAEKKKLAEEKAVAEEAEKKKLAEEKAAAEEAEKQRIAQEQAAEAERQRIAQEQAAAEEQARINQNAQATQPIAQTVYIASSGNGKKYHSNPSCSNMKGVTELSKDAALGRGYSACSKCY